MNSLIVTLSSVAFHLITGMICLVLSVSVSKAAVPQVSTTTATSITLISATLGGDASSDGGAAISERGVVYSNINSSPIIDEAGVTKAINGSGTGIYSESIGSLSPGTTYYHQAYAINADGTAYGGVFNFTTSVSSPTVTTSSATGISSTSATLGGDASSDNGVIITVRGVVYSSSETTPQIGESGVVSETNGSGTGTYSESIGSLQADTTYYFQAYATNSQGTSYGGVTSFTTTASVPTVSTVSVSSITLTSAVLGGNASNNNGASITERGVVYSSSDSTPTIGEPGVVTETNGSGMGGYSETVGSLQSGTTYYYQAYAINSEGTAYGGIFNFTTAVSTPSVTTSSASSVTSFTAALGGNASSDNGATITERGVVYATIDSTPTIGETDVTKNSNGSSTGGFSETIGSLSPATLYYFQAYATNSQGTAYGGIQSFSTLAATPTVSSAVASTVTPSTADLGGNVTAENGAGVIERGVIYSNSDSTPVIGEPGVTKEIIGSGTGVFSTTVSSLSPTTTYYFQAYAINSAGTAYGGIFSFFTLSGLTVIPSAGANGTISPSVPQTVASGNTAVFTLVPESGYSGSVSGTCGGGLVGDTFTTNAITTSCTVIAQFTATNAFPWILMRVPIDAAHSQ